jgi:tyrosine phenol-lyase
VPKSIFEPFKVKVVEPLAMTERPQRERYLEDAGYNLFKLHADTVTFDFLTDSGTTAMSAGQWSAIMRGDESYAGSRSFFRFERVVKDLTGYRHIIPTHQGRAAERILFGLTVGEDSVVPNNNHFDTTRANIEYDGGQALDLVVDAATDPRDENPFKGNIDLGKLRRCLERNAGRVPLAMLTITNNAGGGQPASLDNIRCVSALLNEFEVPFILDACRFAENAWFIKQREPGQQDRSVKEIAQEIFLLADGATFSGKKDGLVNMGGFLALNDDKLAERARNLLILTEGFPTYGGCAARDLEALAVGLTEVLDENYLEYREASVRYLADGLEEIGMPTMRPPGGHAVYVDARAFLPHIPAEQFPGQALACELYLHGGIRSCEIGSVMFGREGKDGSFEGAKLELVRLALPRRVYTQSHIDHVIELAEEVASRADQITGVRMTHCPEVLRHFTARFEPVGQPAKCMPRLA